jgi:hypothetical protein
MAVVGGVLSSKKIMKLINENLVYIYLSGVESSGFRTILRFKIEARELIEEAFQATSKKLNLLNLEHISIDGTKIKANASNNNNLTEEEIKTIKKILQKGIDVDKEEDQLYDEEQNNEVKIPLNKEERKKLIKEVLKEISDAKKDNKNEKPLKKSAANIINQGIKNH